MASLAEILNAQKDYLGGTLPVEKYAFIIYLTPGTGGSGGMGALEHSYSSFYFMPEADEASSAEQMRDVAAHEFFHIVTPLSIHSEEIHYFDYVEPKMSKHLWLYEGVTEYSASHMQIKHGLISMGEYFATLQQKLMFSGFMNDTVPFTVMSAGCLDRYKSQYMNVYQKGALIGLCVDILLREYSGGKTGIQDLMKMLAQNYGKKNPFKDEELFDVIAKLTDPRIRTFFRDYVEDGKPIPYDQIFAKVGILYEAAVNREVLTTGRFATQFNPETKRLYVSSTRMMNAFGDKLKIQEGDELVTWDGMAVTQENFEDVVAQFRAKRKEGDKIVVEVARPDGGSFKILKLKAKAVATRQKGTNVLSVNPSATNDQLALRKSWIGI
jgi:predicted metalloprotease with PDZ domain